MSNVEFKDCKNEIEYFRMALALCEVNMNYAHCDLVMRIQSEVNRLGGAFTVMDAARIRSEWQQEWNDYHKQKEKQNEKQTI